ncbi:Holliday junction resolvase RuvX [Nostocoides veronense]|uniref:Putative pre-16S rRNA nuclease n=1 Tax=Nostocoides veronense TaxID=330836 RepID=A0ABP4XDH6_9MICO
MRRGARLGIDVGSVRVGVAMCDPDGVLAFPVATLARSGADGIPADTGGGDLAEIAELVREHAAIEVIVGLPRSLDGGEGPAAALARGYAQSVAAAIDPVPVRLVDERMTTVDAHRNLRASGVAGRSQRRVVDQAAAVLILQAALDQERATGNPPGSPATQTRRKPRRKGTT